MKNFSKIFPVLKQYTYLNTAASGLLSTPVLEWRQEHDLDFLVMGSKLKDGQGKVLNGVREKVGKLFSCAPNRVALVPNFSYGLNTLLEGIPTTQKVLLLKEDYPSVNWPFTARDFSVSYTHIDANLEENVKTAFAKAQPDIFAFSLVQWLNGIKISHDFLRQIKADYPETLLIADGTQYLGTEAFDFDDSPLDVVGGSTYKWMNAGYGNALFLFKEGVAQKVAPKTTGFNSIQGKYKPQEGNFLGHFEPGHQDTLNFGSLGAAIDVIRQIGVSTIQERIEALALKAKIAFTERGLLEDSVVRRSEHSSIFNLKGDQSLVQRLEDQDILCVARGPGVRVSFHYFNTEKDLEHLLTVLDAK
ncbi:MAG: aminotransferase class V-fold PLP-dependent enzyme [Dokdonia sp.]|nr:aminotransferase class V-fold PLP-dependent enzyme [Dokdonia sp.]